MAHGIIPPFSDHLVCRDFIAQVPFDAIIEGDVLLLGSASNRVEVSQELAEALQAIGRRAYAFYLASGYRDLRKPEGLLAAPAQRVVALLLGIALGVDGAAEALAPLLPHLQPGQDGYWKTLVDGALGYRIQLVEDGLGAIIRESAKDICVHAPFEGGLDRLEMVLCAA